MKIEDAEKLAEFLTDAVNEAEIKAEKAACCYCSCADILFEEVQHRFPEFMWTIEKGIFRAREKF